MGISFNKIPSVLQVYKTNKVDNKKPIIETVSTSNKKDQVQISKEAMDFQTILKSVKQLNNLPDIREDVIGPIKEKLDSGTYSVDSKSVADKMMSSSFSKKA